MLHKRNSIQLNHLFIPPFFISILCISSPHTVQLHSFLYVYTRLVFKNARNVEVELAYRKYIILKIRNASVSKVIL